MKFSSTVDSLSKENFFLRLAVKLLSMGLLVLSLGVIFLQEKQPIVVERTSRGLEIVKATPLARSEQDIEHALKLMLKARFDSNAASPDLFLSTRQLELRQAEQREMKTRSLTQSTVFHNAVVTKESATVEFDRVLAIAEVRSALKTVVKINFEETEPNELNPYGLKLNDAVPVEAKEGR